MQSARRMNKPRLAQALLMLWMGAACALNAAPPEHTRLAGRGYVRITEWARARGFGLHWLKRDETVELSNGACRLVLSANSREAQVNGVAVWLLFPLVPHNGAIWISELDTQSTLEPILSPPRNRPRARIRTICLDPGHGGKDPGNQVGRNQEKRFTLALAQELREQLARSGYQVSLTRNSDRFVDLPSRPELAQRRGADLFVSLHFNSAEESRNSVHGVEVYCLTPGGASSTNTRGQGSDYGWCRGNRHNDENVFLAFTIQKTLRQRLALEDRGVRRARFAVLREAAMPAVLVEAGFMSHPAEGQKIFSGAYRRELAAALVEAIKTYSRIVQRS